MRFFKHATVRTRIVSIFLLLTFLLLFVWMVIFARIEVQNVEQEYAQLSRQTANSLAFMPAMAEAIANGESTEAQEIIDHLRLQADNPIITAVSRDGHYVYHPEEEIIGENVDDGQFTSAIVFGSFITEEDEGVLGPAMVTTAPVYESVGDGEQVVGAITVEFLYEDINAAVIDKLSRLGFVAIFGVAGSIGGAIILGRNIRRDTLGMEPAKIAELYREREGMLYSVKEGVVAINQNQHVTMLNPAAQTILDSLNLTTDSECIDVLGLSETLENGDIVDDDERMYNGQVLIASRRPLYNGEQIVGAICSFRDKTDMKQLQETMIQVQGYSDGLRAQAHEFKNKLYVIMGLLQLGNDEEALELIEKETAVSTTAMPLFHAIKDPGIQAILLGKMAKAAEKKVHLWVDENSKLERTEFTASDVAVMLGNLLDNAIEAVASESKKEISVFITDMGKDIVIDVQDSGPGIDQEQQAEIFQKGSSYKGSGRGFGLSNVLQTARKYGGDVDISSPVEGGAVFSLYLPKHWE
ncbi:sensor histidine kinase [Salicibibacter halophilus]|uniref:histidine kinase n=1 Tax=Salicibibacter halophilus TaxID=2502791 RepID=A0A514LK37_9BACI|nr:sensor histidine kinase [Salicibibacter halophilus]QDI92209.1 sensor histidine kinase [Salicibibacter halophilus]